jgi:hypothetical protein
MENTGSANARIKALDDKDESAAAFELAQMRDH